MPVMEYRSVGSITSTTVTWFMVNVPVLSELIADVEPRVSTESRLFTTAPCAARSLDPLDRMTCSTVGMAMGTAASASAMAVVKIVWVDCPREIPRANMMAMVSPAAAAIHNVNVSSCLVSGVLRCGVDLSIPEMLPTAVLAPVPVTIITPPPCVTGVFMNAMFAWSPRTGFGSGLTSQLVEAGELCRVRIADPLGALGGGNALTGQGGLVDLQGGGLDEPPIGAHVVTGGEQDHVTHDHLFGRDRDLGAVATDPGTRLEHRLQGVHRALCLALLPQAPQRIERRDQKYRHTRGDLPDDHRRDRSPDENDLHVGLVLGQEGSPPRRWLLCGKCVRPVGLQPLGGRRRRDTDGRVDTELLRDVLR